jgi:hypothetical protein
MGISLAWNPSAISASPTCPLTDINSPGITVLDVRYTTKQSYLSDRFKTNLRINLILQVL